LGKAAQGFVVRRTFCTSQPETRGNPPQAEKKDHLWMETYINKGIKQQP